MPYNYFLGTDPALDNHTLAFRADNNVVPYREVSTSEELGFHPCSATTMIFEYESKIIEGVLLEFTDEDRYGKKHIPLNIPELKTKWIYENFLFEGNFEPKQGLLSRYGEVEINPKFYGTLKLSTALLSQEIAAETDR